MIGSTEMLTWSLRAGPRGGLALRRPPARVHPLTRAGKRRTTSIRSKRRNDTRRVVVTGGRLAPWPCAALAAGVLASCGVGTPVPTTSPSVSPSGNAAGIARCAFADLAISDRRAGASQGTWGVVLLFRNDGVGRCMLRGYPGVAGLNGAQQEVLPAVQTPRGHLGGLPKGQTTPPSVLLNPGAVASALVEATDVQSAKFCPTLAGFAVTPPGSRHSKSIMSPTPPVCGGPQVHPVVSGTTGGEG